MAAEASEEVPRPEERYMHMSCGHAKHMSCMHVMRCTCNVSLHYPDDRRDELSRRRDRFVMLVREVTRAQGGGRGKDGLGRR